MFNLTDEERRVILFVLGLAFCGFMLNNLVKASCRVERMIYPAVGLAKLDINKVTLTQLVATKCVSMKLAQRIFERRNLLRKFSSLEELKEVKGIGQQRYDKFKEIFFVE